MKPKLKPPGTKRLKLKRDALLSTSAFRFNLRCYSTGNSMGKQSEEAAPRSNAEYLFGVMDARQAGGKTEVATPQPQASATRFGGREAPQMPQDPEAASTSSDRNTMGKQSADAANRSHASSTIFSGRQAPQIGGGMVDASGGAEGRAPQAAAAAGGEASGSGGGQASAAPMIFGGKEAPKVTQEEEASFKQWVKPAASPTIFGRRAAPELPQEVAAGEQQTRAAGVYTGYLL